MTALITGSFAYDNILAFDGFFEESLIKEKLNDLSISFLCQDMKKNYGGCAGNIIYNCNGIGAKSICLGTLGKDGYDYLNWFKSIGIDTRFLNILDDCYSAQAFIMTDNNSNQITSFYPGAMQYSHTIKIPTDGIELGLVSPDGKEGMLMHTQEFIDHKIPFIFDPGQGMPMFTKDELLLMSLNAKYIVMNSYEYELFRKKTSLDFNNFVNENKVFIITNGDKGSDIFTQKENFHIDSVKVVDAVDPTGCGDAYRAGIIYGILNKMTWDKIGILSANLGATKVEHFGTQNHNFDKIKSLL